MSNSRRSFLKAAGLVVVSTQANAAPSRDDQAQIAEKQTDTQSVYTFFREDEIRFIEAATARLIPADEAGPGAIEAAVPLYIDKQLAGAWGAGERLYRDGPWHEGTPSQGYQLPFTPAELFRNALRGLQEHVRSQYSASFEELTEQQQDEYLETLQKGGIDLAGVPSHVFFESLWGMTVEGFFSDPVYGGNRDMIAWKMIGFPGAHASFYELVDQHGILYERPPMSLAQNARGAIRIHPDIPASTGNATAHGNDSHLGGH